MPLRRAVSIASLVAFVLAGLPFAAVAQDAAPPAPAPSFAEPSISPDHSEIAFVEGGDVWSVPSAGGTARLLADVGGTAARPLFSPDGKRLAYVSSRAGAIGVYVITLDGGEVRRLTHDDAGLTLEAWSADSRALYFSSNARNISSAADVYRVGVDGGTPMPVLDERYVDERDAAPSPDGTRIAFSRNGFAQWWRRGHSHIDQSNIVIEDLAARRYETVTNGDAKDRWPMWAPDGRTLYFVSDRDGGDQLYARADGRVRKLTALTGRERVLWPTASRDGRMIAFEHEFGIWTYDTQSGETKRLAIAPRGLPSRTEPQHLAQTSLFSGLDLAPDGKKLAFVARGRVFAAGSREGGEAQPVTTRAGAAYADPVWAPGSRRLAYVVDRGTEQAVATYDFGADTNASGERIVTPPGHHDDYPHWSPDGGTLAFVRDGRELHALDVATRADRVIARGILDRRPFGDKDDIAFSPAGDWIAYVDNERSGFANARVVRPGGGESHAITTLSNANGGPLAWAPDGTRLFIVTSQRTENGSVAQVDLIPRAPKFREDAFRELFPELPSRAIPTAPPSTAPSPVTSGSPSPSPAPSPSAAPGARKRETRIVFDGIRERVTFLPTGLDVSRVRVSPDGKQLVLVATAAAQENLYAFSIDDTAKADAVAHQLTSTPSRKSALAISPDSQTVFYLDAGRAYTVPLAGEKPPHALALAAELDADFDRDKPLLFRQAWSLLERWYADPTFHGADWQAVRRTYEPHALAARTPEEFRRVVSLMLGELNSSHLGISGAPAPGTSPVTVGRIGVRWNAAEYERTGRLRVAEIVPLGPLALAGRVAAGDELLAVDGTPLDRRTDLDALLANRIGKRTELRFAHATVPVLPIDRPSEKNLLYRAWVGGRRAYVERVSGGRLGYVHLYDMGPESLTQFYQDLDVQNRGRAGVVIDIRNNNGGFVDPYALDVITRREYLRFASRFGFDAPERTALGQRALDRPTVLVTNEHTLSDGENMAEGYRRLGAGKIVGVPTAGWIIFTSETTLADGSTLRLPATRVLTRDGVDMELHPRPVDVRVENPPGAAERGADPQLDAAVRVLLGRAVRR
jgi:tricorn protease